VIATSPRTLGQTIAAVVVTYNPDATLERNLSAIRAQVDRLLVVDNGSADLAAVERAVVASDGRLVSNSTNLGVASALNQGLRLAKEAGFDWLATFDQDSFVPVDTLPGLLSIYESHPDREKIAILAASHRDRVTGRPYQGAFRVLEQTAKWRSVRAAITSGTVVRLAALATTGWFDDRLFIDSVDHDFCLRTRARGLLVVEGSVQVIDHSLGDISAHRLFWGTVNCTNHAPLRRYYITRNQLEIMRRHVLNDPVWVTLAAFDLLAGSVAVLVYEKERLAKIAAMSAGVRDFVFRRFGPFRTTETEFRETSNNN
jgi:rhamnosyltransferase